MLTMSSDTRHADIYYTLDGSEPTRRSNRYMSPFRVRPRKTVKAFAVKKDYNDSDVTSFTVPGGNPLIDFIRIHWLWLTALVVVMIVAAYGIDYWFTYSDAVIASRMSELGGEGVSGRTEIWVTVLDRIVNSNPLTILFGHGYNAVGLLSNDHLGAHNDFLEVLYDFGFIAFIAYCALYVKLFKKTIKLIKNHSKYAAPLGMSLTIFFIESMSSQIVTAPFFGVMFSMTWAFILAQNDIELHRIR